MDYYPCFMISKTLLDEGKWSDDERITLQVEDGEPQIGHAINAKVDMGNREWDDFRYLLNVIHGAQPALIGSKVKAFVRAVIRYYEGIVETAKRASFTILFEQGDSYGRLTVSWAPNSWGGTPSYVSSETPDYLWIETEETNETWRKA